MRQSANAPRVLALAFAAETGIIAAAGDYQVAALGGLVTVFFLAKYNDQIGALPRELGPGYMDRDI